MFDDHAKVSKAKQAYELDVGVAKEVVKAKKAGGDDCFGDGSRCS